MTSKDFKEGMEQEPFLARWSRLKQVAQDSPPQVKAPEKGVDPEAPPPELPPVDKLTFDSDYRAFFHPKVSEDARRAALKKLFSDPRFNVMDGLDVYVDDYSKTEPIPPAMLAGLRQAQKILEWAKGDEKEAPPDRAKPEVIADSQPATLESRVSTGAPDPSAGEQVADTVPVAADPAAGNRSSGNS